MKAAPFFKYSGILICFRNAGELQFSLVARQLFASKALAELSYSSPEFSGKELSLRLAAAVTADTMPILAGLPSPISVGS